MSTIDELRTTALALPGAYESADRNGSAFKAGGKLFAVLNDKHGIGIRIGQEERAELIAAEPDKFYLTAHDEKFRMMRLRLENIDSDELRELLTDAWRMVAGSRLRTELPPER